MRLSRDIIPRLIFTEKSAGVLTDAVVLFVSIAMKVVWTTIDLTNVVMVIVEWMTDLPLWHTKREKLCLYRISKSILDLSLVEYGEKY